MRTILTILALTISVMTYGQQLNWGLTGRAGAVATSTKASQPVANAPGADYTYKTGLQLGVGAWAEVSAGERAAIQLMLLPTIRRQHAGEIYVLDPNRNPMADAKSINLSLMAAISALYLHQLTDRFSVGAGIGTNVHLQTKTKVHLDGALFIGGEDVNEVYNNYSYRRFPVYLPLELQLKLTETTALVGQLQVGVSNKLAASETDFKERDRVLQLGLNYRLH
ncbi:hypothetical protein ACMA1I_01105 [Pontibacter sp. 13R65]|uniref:hypothetical protein n=1 Tax=Pontibacter sp. 13R65 TaxID=3127458 RepID=UPI00301D7CD3